MAVGKPTNQQVARAGEHYVVAELHRRGADAACFGGNMPRIDVLAADREQTRTVAIQVKTKTGRDWQTSTAHGRHRDPEDDSTRFWILVDLSGEAPGYYVVPEWWMQADIQAEHDRYLARHGGQRARTPGSTHHAIAVRRVEQWRDRWDLLGIFE